MYKFKPGDRVICIDIGANTYKIKGLTFEKTYKVVRLLNDGLMNSYILIINDRNIHCMYLTKRFKLSYETMCADIGIE